MAPRYDTLEELQRTQLEAGRAMLAALETTAGNVRSLGPAGALPEPYRPWLAIVGDAIAAAKAAGIEAEA